VARGHRVGVRERCRALRCVCRCALRRAVPCVSVRDARRACRACAYRAPCVCATIRRSSVRLRVRRRIGATRYALPERVRSPCVSPCRACRRAVPLAVCARRAPCALAVPLAVSVGAPCAPARLGRSPVVREPHGWHGVAVCVVRVARPSFRCAVSCVGFTVRRRVGSLAVRVSVGASVGACASVGAPCRASPCRVVRVRPSPFVRPSLVARRAACRVVRRRSPVVRRRLPSCRASRRA